MTRAPFQSTSPRNLEFLPSICKPSNDTIDIGSVSKQKLRSHLSDLRRKSTNENISARSQHENVGLADLNNGYSGVVVGGSCFQGGGTRHAGGGANMQAELLSLRKEYAILEKQYKQELLRRSDLEQFERTIKDQKIQIRELQNELSDERRRNKTREMSLRNKSNTDNFASDQWKEILARLEQEKRLKQSQLAEKESECVKLAKQVKGLSGQLEEMKESECSFKEKLATFEAEVSKGLENLEIIKKLNLERQELLDGNKVLLERLDKISNELGEALESRESLLRELNDLKVENEEARAKISETQREKESILEQMRGFERECKEIGSSRSVLQDQIEELMSERRLLVSRTEELLHNIGEYERDIAALRLKISTLESENADYISQIEKLMVQGEKLKSSESIHLKQLEDKTGSIEKLKRDLETMRKESKNSINCLEDRIKMLEMSNKKSEDIISELTRRNDSLILENKQMKESRDEFSIKNDELIKINEKIAADLNERIIETQKLSDDVELNKTWSVEKEVKLNESISELKLEIETLRNIDVMM